MKKIIAMLLALVMICSLATVAFAATTDSDGDFVDETTITIEKEYKLTNEGTKSPAETFTFTALTCTSITNVGLNAKGDAYYTIDGADNTLAAPVPTITSIEYAAGDAGSANAKKTATITMPKYEAVGVYTYTFNEKDNNTAGVTYYGKTMTLVVTVVQDDAGKVRVAAVHCESPVDTSYSEEGEAVDGTKTDKFVNVYSAGELKITKEVTGNLGDLEKQFKMTVTFTAPNGDTVNETISYNDGTEQTIAAGWTGTKSVDIYVKHDETVTFTNVPYGVTYTVTEGDYTGEGYDAPVYSAKLPVSIAEVWCQKGATNTVNGTKYEYEDALVVDTANEAVKVVNNKEAEVDTGIVLESAPYVLILAVAVIGLAVVFSKKRYEA